MSSPTLVKVTENDVGVGSPEAMIRKFIKKCKKQKLQEEVLRKEFFIKPSVKRRLMKQRAVMAEKKRRKLEQLEE